jgi:hypothetical protein
MIRLENPRKCWFDRDISPMYDLGQMQRLMNNATTTTAEMFGR